MTVRVLPQQAPSASAGASADVSFSPADQRPGNVAPTAARTSRGRSHRPPCRRPCRRCCRAAGSRKNLAASSGLPSNQRQGKGFRILSSCERAALRLPRHRLRRHMDAELIGDMIARRRRTHQSQPERSRWSRDARAANFSERGPRRPLAPGTFSKGMAYSPLRRAGHAARNLAC
jgi:hypothetical protein